MIKYNDEYFPSIYIFGEWYFIVKKNGKINAVPHRPKKGLSLDRATAIENEYKNKTYSEVEKIARFANKLVNYPIEEINPENKHEENVLQYFINKFKGWINKKEE